MRLHTTPDEKPTTRRRMLAVSATALVTVTSGCAAIREFTSDLALDDANVFNMVDKEVEGSIEVVDPAGDTAIEETFDLAYEEDHNSGDVFGDPGEYEVNVELTNTDIKGASQAETTVSVDDVSEERIGVVFTTNDDYDPIVVRVGTTPSDFLEVR